MHSSKFSIHATARAYPPLPYQRMKDDILGTSYELSLVFVGRERARELNKKNRKKSYAPNVLSFPLAQKVGEIYITPTVAKKQAGRFGMTYTGYVGYLFIHGLLHLKGHHHGATMEQAEKRCISRYKLK